jgi:copper chaperone CopZ
MLSLLILAGAASADMLPTGRAVVKIEGMTCMACETKVRNALATVEGLGVVTASLTEKAACVEVTAPTPSEDVEAAIASISYKALSVESVDLCPAALSPGGPKRLWAVTAGMDVEIISRGETVTLLEHQVADKFTVYDFGADWCGPCHISAKRLRAYLSAHPDTAVRVIALDGASSEESFALPAAKQHLEWVGGLPYFEVYSPAGKRIYKGSNAGKALAQIDKARAK